jgi:hypothetical protein
MQSVHADAGASPPGELTEVEITGVKPNSLTGRVVTRPSQPSSEIA